VQADTKTVQGEMSLLNKKGKANKGETCMKKAGIFQEPETGASLWDMNFERATFFKEHFVLSEVFEDVRKVDHFGLFKDVSVSCLCSTVLLEVMEEKYPSAVLRKEKFKGLKQESEELKGRVN
jgi:hypothetical protein